MCFSRIHSSRPWNWDGDEIIHDTVVPSSRPVPGHEREGSYAIDVREFLVTDHNAVVRDVLERKIISPSFRVQFNSRAPKSFDFRAYAIKRWVGENIRYDPDTVREARTRDVWMFPDETLHVGAGDCEDRALLLASLLLASGISPYNVRVALGRLVFRHGRQEVAAFDRAWVVYKRERGVWEVLEPVAIPKKRPKIANRRHAELLLAQMEYEPAFVFNGDHLWRIAGGGRARGGRHPAHEFSDRVSARKAWKRFHPSFAGDVHYQIIDEALRPWGGEIVDQVRQSFTYVFGNYVDKLDKPWNYDPIDHFDNCAINAGWKRVGERLQRFASTKDLDAFGMAAHGIADFYAHTSYGHFARTQGRGFVPFDAAWLAGILNAELDRPAEYDQPDFDLTSARFTVGPEWGSHTRVERATEWAGQLISGRYAHSHDSQAFFERFTWIPKAFRESAGFWRCSAAPHHEEMAVDVQKGSNKLYAESQFEQQFERREATAVVHISTEFRKVWGPPQ